MSQSGRTFARMGSSQERLVRRMAKFGVVSVVATVADLGVFNTLLIIDAAPLWVATSLGYTVGSSSLHPQSAVHLRGGRQDKPFS